MARSSPSRHRPAPNRSGWQVWLLDRVWLVRRIAALRQSFWFQPLLFTVLGALLPLVCLYLDDRYDVLIASFLPVPESTTVRTVASTLAGSMMGVIGTVFTITMAVLTLASSQFGPRLLRQFLRDGAAQGVLGLFLATFTFHLTQLSFVRSSQDELGPPLTFFVGLAVTTTAVVGLVYFIQHFARGVQVDALVHDIGTDFSTKVRVLAGTDDSPAAEERTYTTTLNAASVGYICGVDLAAMARLLASADAHASVLVRPGTHVLRHEPVLQLTKDLPDSTRAKLRDCFDIGPERSEHQDLEFSVDQLAEIAVRALSPGINDPYTAERCVDRLTECLCDFAEVFPLDPCVEDTDGTVRVWMRWPVLDELMSSAFNKIRQAAERDVSVSLRLITSCMRLAESTPNAEVHAACAEHVVRVQQGVAGTFSPADQAQVDERVDRFQTAFGGSHEVG